VTVAGLVKAKVTLGMPARCELAGTAESGVTARYAAGLLPWRANRRFANDRHVVAGNHEQQEQEQWEKFSHAPNIAGFMGFL